MRKTCQMVEKALVDGMLSGEFKPGRPLLSERDLAARFEVSRATVREALQKLQDAGWISVQQRHCTIVKDFWSQGDLEILSSITRNSEPFPYDLATHLLELRVQFAPDYARRAVENDAAGLAAVLRKAEKLRNCSSALVKFDWELHLAMAVMSGNRIYPLMLNSFAGVYSKLRSALFSKDKHRLQLRDYYRELLAAANAGNSLLAENITRGAMMLRLSDFKLYFGSLAQDCPAPA
ncbi:GntR family transcriptional regulator [Geomonas subterranea]|uniref:Fatty acid metabolism regulator n=1 Tax=Geomonas subterranea TaxID=2847989 RepID=A0ABX8LJX2_9BACT|nr:MULTISPECIES: GntR family transcriptional regulator [Geomonas]QXE91997.1 fatty acid metabolism regulator [Geomonas subterranea]QXM09910.1 fatty acid metabolism regulator [Geomonas subterranea]